MLSHKKQILALSTVAIVVGLSIALTPVVTPSIAETNLEDSTATVQETHTAGASQHIRVEVTNNTTAYEAGEMLTDQSLYPLQNTAPPVVFATVDAQDATITDAKIQLTYEAAPRTAAQDTFYTNTTTLVSAPSPGPGTTLNATLPIKAIIAEQRALRNEFGSDVIITTDLQTVISYKYESANGAVFEDTATAGGTIVTDKTMYSAPSDTTETTHTTGGTHDSGSDYTAHINAIAIVLSALGVTGLVALIVCSRRYTSKAIKRKLQRRQFNEWVTEVESYTPEGSMSVAEVTSLSDLVNLAIDTQRRVLYHKQVDEYIVVDGSTLFKFTPDQDSDGGSIEMFGMDTVDLEDLPPLENFEDIADTQKDD